MSASTDRKDASTTPSSGLKLPKVRMTKEQRAWCKNYMDATTFEALMDDFLAGNETFVEAAKKSCRWFEDWSSDAYLSASHRIPGADA